MGKKKSKPKKDKNDEKEKEVAVQRNQPLLDDQGIIRKAVKILPDDNLKVAFLEALDELETHECYRTRKFPKTDLKRLTGIKLPVYRGHITKTSGWRFHVIITEANQVRLADVLTAGEHDDCRKVVRTRKDRYE